MLKRFLAAAAAALLGAAALTVPSPAAAHPNAYYYTNGKWPTNATIRFAMNSGGPNGDFLSRVLNGRDHWNNQDTGNEPQAYWTLPDYVNYGSFANPCTLTTGSNNTGVVFSIDLDYLGSEVAGATQLCRSGSTITKASLAFDNDIYWYTGTGATPGGYMDVWAVATHEFGHFFGHWIHFAEGEAGVCPPSWDNNRHAMCPAIPAGTWVQRHIKTHDNHTYTAAY